MALMRPLIDLMQKTKIEGSWSGLHKGFKNSRLSWQHQSLGANASSLVHLYRIAQFYRQRGQVEGRDSRQKPPKAQNSAEKRKVDEGVTEGQSVRARKATQKLAAQKQAEEELVEERATKKLKTIAKKEQKKKEEKAKGRLNANLKD
jgi:hypothetical protein